MLDTVVIAWCWLLVVQVLMCLFGHQYNNNKGKRSGSVHAWHSWHSFVLTVGGAGVDVSVWGGPQQAQPQHRPLCPALRYGGQPSQNCWVSFAVIFFVSLYRCITLCVHLWPHSQGQQGCTDWYLIWQFSLSVYLCLCLLYLFSSIWRENNLLCVVVFSSFLLVDFLLLFIYERMEQSGR